VEGWASRLILGVYLRLGRRRRLSTIIVLVVHGHESASSCEFHHNRSGFSKVDRLVVVFNDLILLNTFSPFHYYLMTHPSYSLASSQQLTVSFEPSWGDILGYEHIYFLLSMPESHVLDMMHEKPDIPIV